jgi:hypothetical protein
VQFALNQCPLGSIYGIAKAFTPLLDKPLEGPVYFRSNGGERELPDIVADLKGQVDIDLVGFVDSVNGRIRTTFDAVPDAPVTKFVLEMQGGKKGLIVNSQNLCASKHRAIVRFSGQNGKVYDTKPVIGTGCGKKKGKKK